MAGRMRGVPEGFHTVTPYLVVEGASGAIEFYEEAFGRRRYSVRLTRTEGSGTPRS